MSSTTPEAVLDQLIDEGIVDETDDGALTTTEEYERARNVYHDTYADISQERLVEVLAELFGAETSATEAYVEEHDVTPDDLIAYLSLQSVLDPVPDRETLAVMAALVVDIGPGSPVPPQLEELDDDSYEAFLEEHPDAVLTVWKTGCHPCEAMKDDLDAILDRVPEGVAVAGLDGESVPSFRLEFGIDSAPAVLAFEGGDLAESLTGRRSPFALEQFFSVVYGVGDWDPVSAIEDELEIEVDSLDDTDSAPDQ